MAIKNVYDIGGGRYRIVANYKGQQKAGKVYAANKTDAAKEQDKLLKKLMAEVDGGTRDHKTVPTLWLFCAERNLTAAPPVTNHGLYRLYLLNRKRIGKKTYENRCYTILTLCATEMSDKRLLGQYRLDEIGAPQLLEYQDIRAGENLEASTINTETNVLRGILSFAVLNKIPGVQMLGKKLAPDLPEAKIEAIPWTEKQMIDLLEAAWRRSRRLYGIILAIANTGMRKGEAINLQWSGVDLDSLTITLRPSAWWKPKDNETRSIPISEPLAEYFKSMRRESTYVFVSRKGEPYAYWPQLQFDEAREAAKLDGGPHRLRHTFASHFLANWRTGERDGDPMMVLAKVLGHSRAQMSQAYSHFLPGALDAARGLVSFGGEASTKARGAWSGGGVKRKLKK